MADDYNFETTPAFCPDLRISELSETCNTFNHIEEQAPKSSASEPKDDIVSHVNADIFANNSSNAVFQEAESESFKEDDEEQDKNVIYGVVHQELRGRDEKLEIAGATATCLNDIALVKQGKKGFEDEETVKMAGASATCFDDTVFQKQEWASGSFNDAVLEIQESKELVDVEAAILSKQELKLNEVNGGVSENSEMGVSGFEKRLKFDEQMKGKTYNSEGSVKCALKIEVIDETALVKTPVFGRVFGKDGKLVNLPEHSRKNVNNKRNDRQETGGNKEKRPSKGGKSKNSGVDEKSKNLADLGLSPISEIGNFQGSDNEKGKKKVYMRKELEALRFVGFEGQKKKWIEVYCGLGPAVQKEYDGLMDSGNRNQCHQKHIHGYFNPRFRNEAPSSIFGEESSENADDDITYKNPMDATFSLLLDIDEKGCLVGQEDCIDDDSDEDYSSIQKPVFLVTGEPDFDSGPPDDGLEYLRRVRWEAAQIPKVKVAKVDRSRPNKEQTIYMPQIPDVAKCPVHLMPLKEWEDAFLADFAELRLALSRYDVSETMFRSSASVHNEESSKLFDAMLLENLDNIAVVEDSCQSVSCTISETCGNPRCSSVANENSDSIESPSSKLLASGASERYPTLSMILRMDSVARVSMLRKRISMAESMSKLSRADCLWLFALSAAVDCPLDADTCAAFRSLLRKCASLRAEKSELDEEVATLNILVTISGRYFGQLEK